MSFPSAITIMVTITSYIVNVSNDLSNLSKNKDTHKNI
jgi:hypothetical protein